MKLERPDGDRSGTEPPFDPTSWAGAIWTMLGLLGVLWIVQIVNASDNYRLDRFGLRPRSLAGLEGVLTSPFLHASYGHLLANSGPFVLLGWVVLLSGVRPFLIASAIVIVLGGLATWLVSPSGQIIVGASGLILGWLGYLLARAYFSRRILWIVAAVLVVFFFGGLFGSLLPSINSDVSWQGHLCGFGAGIVAGWAMHPRHGKSRLRLRSTPSEPGSVS